MTREIKFRAWDNINKKMVEDIYDHTFYKSLNDCLKNSFVMQYTGLKDKNGKEIYEGDIILFPHRRKFAKGQVVFYNSGYKIQYQEPCFDKFISLFVNIYEFELEVIGNIYENPELLK